MSEPVARPPLQPIQSTGGLDMTDPAVLAQLQTVLDAAQGKKAAQPTAKGKSADSTNKQGSHRNNLWKVEEEEAL